MSPPPPPANSMNRGIYRGTLEDYFHPPEIRLLLPFLLSLSLSFYNRLPSPLQDRNYIRSRATGKYVPRSERDGFRQKRLPPPPLPAIIRVYERETKR